MSNTPQPSAEPPEEQAISLDELSRAYVDAIGPGADAGRDEESVPDAAEGETVPEDLPPAEEPEADDGPCPIGPDTILEAMLFVGNRENEPLSAARAAELMRGVEPGEIRGLVDGLNRRYEADGCPYHITSEGPGYRLVLRRSFDPIRNKFYGRIRQAHLSQAAVDVLAIVAYRQPLTRDQVDTLRGTPSSHVLAQLVRRRLLKVVRPSGKRQPGQYHTTERFLDLFGLESLGDLPQAEEPEPR